MSIEVLFRSVAKEGEPSFSEDADQHLFILWQDLQRRLAHRDSTLKRGSPIRVSVPATGDSTYELQPWGWQKILE